MKPYGLPRSAAPEILEQDSCRLVGGPSKLAGRVRGRKQTRRTWKRKARGAAKAQCQEYLTGR